MLKEYQREEGRHFKIKNEALPLGEIESVPKNDTEKPEKDIDAFMYEMLSKWYKEAIQKADIQMSSPALPLDYERLASAEDPALFGQYTTNPENTGIDYQKSSPKIVLLPMTEFDHGQEGEF